MPPEPVRAKKIYLYALLNAHVTKTNVKIVNNTFFKTNVKKITYYTMLKTSSRYNFTTTITTITKYFLSKDTDYNLKLVYNPSGDENVFLTQEYTHEGNGLLFFFPKIPNTHREHL